MDGTLYTVPRGTDTQVRSTSITTLSFGDSWGRSLYRAKLPSCIDGSCFTIKAIHQLVTELPSSSARRQTPRIKFIRYTFRIAWGEQPAQTQAGATRRGANHTPTPKQAQDKHTSTNGTGKALHHFVRSEDATRHTGQETPCHSNHHRYPCPFDSIWSPGVVDLHILGM